MKTKKRIKTGGRTNSYGEKTVVRAYRVPKSKSKDLDEWVKLFLNKCKDEIKKRTT